jgi:O-antigen/teichoic acid export membrane protein
VLTNQIAAPLTEEREAVEIQGSFSTDHLIRDIERRTARGGVYTLGAHGARFVVQIGSTAVLARLLRPEDFGLLAMAAATTGVVGMFKDLGLSQATIQRRFITHAQVSTLFWTNVGLSVILGVFQVLTAPLIVALYGHSELLWVTIGLAMLCPLGGIAAQPYALLVRQMRFRAMALIQVGALFVGAVTAVMCAWLGAGYWSLVAMVGSQALATAVMSLTLCGWVPGRPGRFVDAFPMLKFGSHVTAESLCTFASRNMDQVIIGAALGAGPLGFYTRAYSLVLFPIQQINAPLNGVVLPALSRLQANPTRFRAYFLRALSLVATVSAPPVAFAIIAAPRLVLVVLGAQWSAAVPIFRWLGPAALCGTIAVAPSWIFISLGYTRLLVRWGMLNAACAILGFCAAIPWGVKGVAISASVSSFLGAVLMLRSAARCSGIPLRSMARSLVAPLIAASAAAGSIAVAAIVGLSANTPVDLVYESGLFGAVYLLALLAQPDGRALAKTARHLLPSAPCAPATQSL